MNHWHLLLRGWTLKTFNESRHTQKVTYFLWFRFHKMSTVGKSLGTRRRSVISDPWVRKIPGGGHGNPFQYSCLKNPMDRRAWWAIVHRVTQSWTRLKRLSTAQPFVTSYIMYVCVCTRACVCVRSLQSCPTLCDPMDYSPPGSSVHGILQARILEWVAMPTLNPELF